MIIFSQVEPMFKPVDARPYWMMPSPTAMLMDDSHVEQMRQQELFRQQQQMALQKRLQENFLQYFGMPQFQPDEVDIQLDKENRQIIITGKHERNTGMEFETCQFTKRISVPANVNMDEMRCIVADNGLLQVEAPLIQKQPPALQQQPVEREIPIQFVNQKPAITAGSVKPSGDGPVSTERIIPIEFVDLRPRPSPPAPIMEESIQAKPAPAPTMAKKPAGGCPMAAQQPCRPPVREIPITIVRRPMDQGVLCPCCRDGRFNCLDGAGHSCKPKAPTGPAQKKDFQPKNATAAKPQAEPEVQIEDIGMDDK